MYLLNSLNKTLYPETSNWVLSHKKLALKNTIAYFFLLRNLFLISLAVFTKNCGKKIG